MRRTGFKRPERQRTPPPPAKPLDRPVNAPRIEGMAQPVPKEAPVRSEAYRRLVAALPCARCGIEGYSQCAHSNQAADGKGMACKASDLATFPLCADRWGVVGCHTEHDQSVRMSPTGRKLVEDRMVRETQRKILASGKWPLSVPIPEYLSVSVAPNAESA